MAFSHINLPFTGMQNNPVYYIIWSKGICIKSFIILAIGKITSCHWGQYSPSVRGPTNGSHVSVCNLALQVIQFEKYFLLIYDIISQSLPPYLQHQTPINQESPTKTLADQGLKSPLCSFHSGSDWNTSYNIGSSKFLVGNMLSETKISRRILLMNWLIIFPKESRLICAYPAYWKLCS